VFRGVGHKAEILDDAVRCGDCTQSFSSMWGVPFLGAFRQDDVLSLVEMVSHAQEYMAPSASHDSFEPVLVALEEYARSDDKPEVLRKHGFSPKPPWWDHRYHEQVEFNLVAAGIDFGGARVLDVGAGMGSDALRYARRGARVTALEFSFSLFGPGARLYPQFRWIGGAAHALPFADESFDVVVAHNSLHHHTDQRLSMSEMLRVLRPGGHLITTGDPFRSDDQTELDECRVFDAHAGVLTGTNEQIPTYSAYTSVLARYAHALEIDAFIADSATDACMHLQGEHAMPGRMAVRNGGLSLRVRKAASFATAPSAMGDSIVAPAEFARRLGQGVEPALDAIVPAIDERVVDLPLLDSSFPKFRLLNGWRLWRDGEPWRTAYVRGRLFFRNAAGMSDRVSVTLAVPSAPGVTHAMVRVKVNGKTIANESVSRGRWHTLQAARPAGTAGSTFSLEIDVDRDRAVPGLERDESLEFRVSDVSFGTPDPLRPTGQIEECSLASLAASGVLGARPLVLCSRNYYLALEAINAIAPHTEGIRVLVPDDQVGYYEWLAGVTIQDRYPASGAGTRRWSPDVVVAATPEAARAMLPFVDLSTRPAHGGPWIGSTAPFVSRLRDRAAAASPGIVSGASMRTRARAALRRIPLAVALWRLFRATPLAR
jgi:SAM-dependent methyltransferase